MARKPAEPAAKSTVKSPVKSPALQPSKKPLERNSKPAAKPVPKGSVRRDDAPPPALKATKPKAANASAGQGKTAPARDNSARDKSAQDKLAQHKSAPKKPAKTEKPAKAAKIVTPLDDATRAARRAAVAIDTARARKDLRDTPQDFDVLIIGQAGRLGYEALLFVASLRHCDPDFQGTIYVGEPQPGPMWKNDPHMAGDVRDLLIDMGAVILPFESKHFGQSYAYGNKIEALMALPAGRPFVFFDTDTLITGPLSHVPFDFDRPTASLKREGTWPQIELYGPGYADIWGSLYARFGLDFASSLDLSQPDEYWARYLYFNAGFFFYRCGPTFGQRFLEIAVAIRDDRPDALVCQSLDPWLDQVALPLVIHGFGGARDTLPPGQLDGIISCHYRLFPLLYARESDHVITVLETVAAPNKIKKVLKTYEPIKRMVIQNRGQKVRDLFDQDDLPRREAMIRNTIKRANMWMR